MKKVFLLAAVAFATSANAQVVQFDAEGIGMTETATEFAENATIYVDADNLKDIIKIQGTYNNQGLTINKLENQTIVFNFKSNRYNWRTFFKSFWRYSE